MTVTARAFEAHENAKTNEYSFENRYGKVQYTFLERNIPFKLNGKVYKDIVTPYGFGGPIITETIDEEKLLADYYKAFHEYCLDNHIVAEFVRFHPLANQRARERFNGTVQTISPQVIRDLSQPRYENMSKSIKRDYKRAVKRGFTVVFEETGEHLDDFLSIYYSTMDRNAATNYYYFDRSFFEALQEELIDHIVYTHVLYEGQVIYSGLCLYDDDCAYGFLGGTAEGFYKYCPETFMILETFQWFREHGVSHYLMGGGHGKEDGLFRFKRKFANDGIYPYQVGKKIHHSSVYNQFVALRATEENFDSNTSFFPAYRDLLSKDQMIRKSAYVT